MSIESAKTGDDDVFGQFETRVSELSFVRKSFDETHSSGKNFEFVDLDEISPADDKASVDFQEDFLKSHSAPPSENNLILLEFVTEERKHRNYLRNKEQNEMIRVTILYTLAFFALVFATFFIIYLA